MKSNLSKLLSAGILATLCTVSHSSIANMLINPGFENDFDDWREIESAAVSNDERSGSKAAKLSNSTGQLRQTVSVVPNTEYLLTGYVKGAGLLGVNTGGSTTSKRVSGESSYTLVSVSFVSGSGSTVDVFLKYNGAEGRFDDLSLTQVGSSSVVTIPAKIEAEDYTGYYDTTSGNVRGEYRDDDVDIAITSDDGGGYNIGWMVPGEYLEYEIVVPNSGEYKATIRASTIRTNAEFYISLSGSKIGNNVSIDNTGGWQVFEDFELELGNLSAGAYTLSYHVVGNNANLNWIGIEESDGGESFGSTVNVPGKIEAENFTNYYDLTSGNAGGGYNTDVDVDMKATADSGGGYQVGWFQNTEWLEYTINVQTAGDYQANVRASSRAQRSISMQVDGSNVVTDATLSNTGSYAVFADNTIDIGYLSTGTHTLRLTNTSNYFDVNYITLSLEDEPNPGTNDCNIDMTIWGYTLNDGISRNDKSDIQDLVDNRNLGGNEITFNDGCVSFRASNDGDTSEGSQFVRSELREQVVGYTDTGPDDTDIENQWVTSEYNESDKSDAGGVDGIMTATLTVDNVSIDGDNDQIGRIIVGQIHGIDHEPVKIYYMKAPNHSKGSVWYTVDGSNGSPSDRIYMIGYSDKDYSGHNSGSSTLSNPSNGIALGDEWSYEIRLIGDQLRVTIWHDGNVYTTSDGIALTKQQSSSRGIMRDSSDTDAITLDPYYDDDWMYFKVGLYNQNNTGSSSDYSEVTFSQIDVEHF